VEPVTVVLTIAPAGAAQPAAKADLPAANDPLDDAEASRARSSSCAGGRSAPRADDRETRKTNQGRENDQDPTLHLAFATG
jgi:hypothetical protein